jgi:hypothetical protein
MGAPALLPAPAKKRGSLNGLTCDAVVGGSPPRYEIALGRAAMVAGAPRKRGSDARASIDEPERTLSTATGSLPSSERP